MPKLFKIGDYVKFIGNTNIKRLSNAVGMVTDVTTDCHSYEGARVKFKTGHGENNLWCEYSELRVVTLAEATLYILEQ